MSSVDINLLKIVNKYWYKDIKLIYQCITMNLFFPHTDGTSNKVWMKESQVNYSSINHKLSINDLLTTKLEMYDNVKKTEIKKYRKGLISFQTLDKEKI